MESLCQCVGSGNNKKASEFRLIGIQLPEKYKENFDVPSEAPSLSGLPEPEGPSLETSKMSLHCSGIPINLQLSYLQSMEPHIQEFHNKVVAR